MSAPSRVLAVDDELSSLDALRELLAAKYLVEIARSGEDALDVAGRFRPEVVLLDVGMPGIGGYETCKRLRSREDLAEAKVIMFSARAEADARIAAYEAGAHDYLIKPARHEEILAKVDVWSQLASRQDVHRLAGQVESLRDGVSEALATVIGFRGVETGGHLFRVRWYSLRIAEELQHGSPYADQVNEDFVRNVYRASPLHDIGMALVRDEILLKPSTLTAQEREQIVLHTEAGAELLTRALRSTGDQQFLRVAVNIARYHHERFDGRGYPTGLAGVRIPLEARIVAVADVFDALTTHRVYRQPLTPNEAVETVEQEAGKQLDDVVVAAFRQCASEFTSAVNHFRETWPPGSGSAALSDQPAKSTTVGEFADVGPFDRNAAHEFSNLLQAIGGYSTFAMKGLAENERPHQYMQKIQAAVDRAALLTRTLAPCRYDDGLPADAADWETTIDARDSAGRQSILIADDEPFVREVACTVLQDAGYVIFTAEDGQAAVDFISQRAAAIDLLLLDVFMPRLNGWDAYRRIGQIVPNLPAVFCTGHDLDNPQHAALHKHGHCIVRKPYRAVALLSAVRQSLEKSLRRGT